MLSFDVAVPGGVFTADPPPTTDPFAVNFGCGFGDVGCIIQEGIAQFFAGLAQMMGEFAAYLIQQAFASSAVPEDSWGVVGGQFWLWYVIAAMLMFALALGQLIPAVILQQGGRVALIILGIIIGPFVTVQVLNYAPQIARVGNQVTDEVIGQLGGGADIGVAILTPLGFQVADNGVVVPADGAFMQMLTLFQPGAAAGITAGKFVLMAVFMGLFLLGALVLYISMAMTAFLLVLLVAFAPLGVMFVGQPAFRPLAAKWGQLVLGVLLAPPLAAGVVVMSVKLISATGDNVALLFVSFGAMFFAALSPFWAVSLVSFAGAGVGQAMERRIDSTSRVSSAGKSAGRAATRAIGKKR